MLLDIIQFISGILLIILILIQSRGSGLGAIFGGGGNVYRTKRGAEKILHVTTVIISILFLGVSFFNVLYS